jgi:two-component system chemotaxis sensor kinase CheA
MSDKDDAFLKRLRETFRAEADEHVRAIRSGLFELEKNPDSGKRNVVLETVFRESHSLKGAARSVGLREIEAVCQPLEGAFAALKRGEIAMNAAHFDLIHQVLEHLADLVKSPEMEPTPQDQSRSRELAGRLGELLTESASGGKPEKSVPGTKAPSIDVVPKTPKEATPASRQPSEEKTNPAETVRIPISRLDPLLLQAEEMIQVKMALDQRTADLREINLAIVTWKTESTKRTGMRSEPSSQKDDAEQESNEDRMNMFQDRISTVTRALEQDRRVLGQMVDSHMEAMKKVLMLPVTTMMELFPTFIRDLSRDQGKEADLVIRGAEIEIDKRILDELKDPLIHLVRNCIDHGIKKPEERVRRNMPPRGTITISFAMKDGHQMEILVSDDGEGIDAEQVRAAAIRAGIVTKEAAGKLAHGDILPMIFYSGLTTSQMLTDLSGRGLGLAIVREKTEMLGGVVSVENRRGGPGTTFRMLMPLSLTTFGGVLVRAGVHQFVLPTMNIERVLRVSREDIGTVENRQTIRSDGKVLSMVRLCDALDLPLRKVSNEPPNAENATSSKLPLVIVSYSGKRIAFQVDEVMDEHQVLMRNLGKQLRRVRNISGATILGNGRVVPVLNVPDLMRSAVLSGTVSTKGPAEAKEPEGKGKILVVEDSITSRTLIRNLLEMAGYTVATAVDGVDGVTQAHAGDFDLVVSDVDMPRLNGFELTTKIRDKKNSDELPVVLVTALDSREDRERGIEVGANAYIVKSSFDQSNLLDVVRRLI